MNTLKALVFLDISYCQLTGSLPDRYIIITQIYINRNEDKAVVFFYFDSLFGLVNLRHLDVSYNRLTNIPNGISNLK